MQVRIVTLGCKVNQSDSESIGAELTRRGFSLTRSDAEADLLLVNTCTVTQVADAKARKLVRRLIRQNPDRPMIVVGCGARVARANFEAIPGVAAVVAGHDPVEVAATVERACGSALTGQTCTTGPTQQSKTTRTRAFLKVQDGCAHHCTYCIVPAARPHFRSRPIEECVQQIGTLAGNGVKEVVLTGVCLGAFGQDRGESLAALLREIRAIELPRLRLSSIEPMDITEELLAEISDHPLLCHHLHLPLQSGDDSVLRAMGRSYSAANFLKLVGQLRRIWPDVSLTADVIAGFPGETETNFQNSFELIERVGFSRLHVFEFSPRPGTPAADFPNQVPDRTKTERSHKLLQLGEQLAAARAVEQVGQMVEVLFEQREDGLWTGYTRGYLRAAWRSEEQLVGQLRELRVTGAKRGTLELRG